MTKIASEYERYQASLIMKKLASFAHAEKYIGQTSSATFDEISCQIQEMNLSQGSRLLDAGCGNGAFSIPLAEHFSFQVTGVDLSEELIKEATENAKNAKLTSRCRFLVEDFTAPFHDLINSFDLVICIGSLYWGQPLTETLRNWYRITRQGGSLLLFLNLQYQPLHPNELKAVGNTQFVQAFSLQEELVKANWLLSYWQDETKNYMNWLNRWCAAMKEVEEKIVMEMGKGTASQLTQRFITYYQLAERKAVRRIILKAEHV